MAEKRPAPIEGQVYKHFKGTLYKILAVAVHTETEEKLVVYQSMENKTRVFARPLDMFMSDVDRFRYPLIRAKYRFTLVEEPSEVEEQREEKNTEAQVAKACEEAKECVEAEECKEKAEVKECKECEADTEDIVKADADSDDTAKYKENGELVLDPYVEAVLDEKEFSKKIESFEFLRGKCTEDMLTMIAISLDIQLIEGTIEEKYAQILQTLKMHDKYESSRLRV